LQRGWVRQLSGEEASNCIAPYSESAQTPPAALGKNESLFYGVVEQQHALAIIRDYGAVPHHTLVFCDLLEGVSQFHFNPIRRNKK